MRTGVIQKLGQTSGIEDFPEPIAAEGQVLLTVLAASLKPVDRQPAAGTHFASPREFPRVYGSDGVGRLEDGWRVFFGGPLRPYGSVAERTVVRRAQCFQLPESLDDRKGAFAIAVEEWPLEEIESAWKRPASSRRLAFRP
jgi:NADPH2:quinone reductase